MPRSQTALRASPQSATLRSLYTRAARAFVLRDVETTVSLLHSAFAILKPPQCVPDALSDDRKKWDILRITFESTLYSSPPASSSRLPDSIRHLLTEAPQALVSSMYTRSLSLFAPSGDAKTSSTTASYLPSQVLTTLVYCSLKVGAPDLGRVMIESWLALREPYDSSNTRTRGTDGYDKVLELYCLHVLPKLGLWDYVKEFLEYESELSVKRREVRQRTSPVSHFQLNLSWLGTQNCSAKSTHPCNLIQSTARASSILLIAAKFRIQISPFMLPRSIFIFILLILRFHNINAHSSPCNPKGQEYRRLIFHICPAVSSFQPVIHLKRHCSTAYLYPQRSSYLPTN